MVEERDLVETYVLGEETPHLLGLLSIEDSDEELIVSIILFALEQVIVEEEEEGDTDEGNHSNEAPEVHDRSDDDRNDEGCTSGDEPSTDHGHNPRETSHGALTSPSAVCQRRTHSDHEGHVGRREGQLHRGTYGDE